jgi:hypothetical protein
MKHDPFRKPMYQFPEKASRPRLRRAGLSIKTGTQYCKTPRLARNGRVGGKSRARLVQFGEEFARKGSDITRHDDGLQSLGMIAKPESKVPRARGAILDGFQLGDGAITLQRCGVFNSSFHF